MTIEQPKPKANWWWAILVFVVFCFIMFKVCNKVDNSSDSSKSLASNHLTLTQGQTDYMEQLQKEGFVRFEYKNAFIDPGLWARMDVKLKEDVACSFAIYCTNKIGDDLYWCEIKDKMTGKKLAKWSKSWGFKIY